MTSIISFLAPKTYDIWIEKKAQLFKPFQKPYNGDADVDVSDFLLQIHSIPDIEDTLEYVGSLKGSYPERSIVRKRMLVQRVISVKDR